MNHPVSPDDHSPGTNATKILNAKTAAAVDLTVEDMLTRSGGPSASIALVLDGKVAYRKAYGSTSGGAGWAPTTETRYVIGSVSKQFTAAAVLLLGEDGKLSLDDPVSRWLPDLTRANDITVRQVLGHTAGYPDYSPRRSPPLLMTTSISPRSIADRWGRLPLDFEPGASWQYSNTGYVIAGLIVESASGESLFEFLRHRVFNPLAMSGVVDYDTAHLSAPDAQPYTRTALAEPRPAPRTGPGWEFATGNLAMRPHDLALWNLSLLERSLLRPASYDALFEPVSSTSSGGYALGLAVRSSQGRKVIGHGGQVSGYLSDNRIYPDERAAITVLTNTDCGAVAADLSDRIAQVVLPPLGVDKATRTLLHDLQRGRLGRTRLTADASAYFGPAVVGDFARTLAPLGMPLSFRLLEEFRRGGMHYRIYRVVFRDRTVDLRVLTSDGVIDEFIVSPSGD